MGIVILARHGTHDEVGRILSGRSEIALNARGRAQAAALASGIDGAPPASLHTSPRKRALQTIAPVADRFGLHAHVTYALDEIDFGAFSGRSFAELEGDPAWRRWNAQRDTACCPGGETMAQAVDRAAEYLTALAPGAFPALCVTHCDVIRGLVSRLLDLSYDRMFLFDCDPGSCTTIDALGPAMRLLSLNTR